MLLIQGALVVLLASVLGVNLLLLLAVSMSMVPVHVWQLMLKQMPCCTPTTVDYEAELHTSPQSLATVVESCCKQSPYHE